MFPLKQRTTWADFAIVVIQKGLFFPGLIALVIFIYLIRIPENQLIPLLDNTFLFLSKTCHWGILSFSSCYYKLVVSYL